MTKKAQFIIPNVFIKEAFGAGMTRGLMQVGQLLTRANKAPSARSLTRAAWSSAVRGGEGLDFKTARGLLDKINTAGTTRGSAARNELAAKLRAVRAGKTPPPLPKTPAATPRRVGGQLPKGTEVTTPVGDKLRTMQGPLKTKAVDTPQVTPAATPPPLPTTAAESAAYSPGLINRALSSTAGRVALPAATGAVGYGFGNSSGYDEGFGQGSLSAQQMAAIQAMQAQQQARQMYDNQGFLDRLMGNNPF
jgi:hypothetical protein